MINRRDLLTLAVCTLTAFGLGLGAVGVCLIPDATAAPWLCLSVAVDALDGGIARRLGAASRAGAVLDWTIDTALSYAIVFRLLALHPLGSVIAMALLVVVQTAAAATGARVSGRSAVTAYAVLWLLLTPPTGPV